MRKPRLACCVLSIVAASGGGVATATVASEETSETWEASLDLLVVERLLGVALERGQLPQLPEEWMPLAALSKRLPESFHGRLPTTDPWGDRYLVRPLEGRVVVVTPGPDGISDAFDQGVDSSGLQIPQVDEQIAGDDMVLVVGFGVLNGPRTLEEHQRQTMAMVRSIGVVVEEYSIDHDLYPARFGGLSPVRDLRSIAEPTYIGFLPSKDSWGNDLLYWSDARSYIIVSPGADGVVDRLYGTDTESIAGVEFCGRSDDPARDIVFANGSFEQWPRFDDP